MPSIKLILSDLHLADGHALLDGFGHAQQEALAGLLNAANSAQRGSSGPIYRVRNPLRLPLGQTADNVELILNGDCFDFLVIPPLQTHHTTNPTTALEKLEKVIAAHSPFFELLHEFLSTPGCSVTFLTGNHDIELCFEEVRSRIVRAIDGAASQDEGVHFCPSRFYRPLPDVYIEHGNQYDFWNAIRGLWDEKGQTSTPSPDSITLPIGSQYVLRVGYPISRAYPYFDHFEPSMNILRQVALLSLIDPDLTRETAERLMGMLSYPRKALANLAPADEHIPARLFEHAMYDFLAFQQDVEAHFPEWKTNSHTLSSEANSQGSLQDEESNQDAIMEFLALHDALTLPPVEAVAAICAPAVYSMGEDVAKGMKDRLKNNSTLRYAIAGHSHMYRVDPIDNERQTYLNTGTWTKRITLPAPSEVTSALVEWLRHPDWQNIPLRDMTQYTFVMIATDENGSSEACLCAWEGGINGNYRVIG